MGSPFGRHDGRTEGDLQAPAVGEFNFDVRIVAVHRSSPGLFIYAKTSQHSNGYNSKSTVSFCIDLIEKLRIQHLV